MQEPSWPKTIVVCLECGKVAQTAYELRLGDDCKIDGIDHGPTLEVSVFPAVERARLIAALEMLQNGHDDGLRIVNDALYPA